MCIRLSLSERMDTSFIPVIARSENALPTLKTVIHPYDEPLYRFHVPGPSLTQRSTYSPSNRNPATKAIL